MKNPPLYLLMENVKGFEESDTHSILLQQLKACGYTFKEFLLSPNQFYIPNSRLRYYLLVCTYGIDYLIIDLDLDGTEINISPFYKSLGKEEPFTILPG